MRLTSRNADTSVAFAMLAVIVADAMDIMATPRRPYSGGGRHRGPSTRKEAPTDPSLRIVALNLADQALDEIYGGGEGGALALQEAPPTPTEPGDLRRIRLAPPADFFPPPRLNPLSRPQPRPAPATSSNSASDGHGRAEMAEMPTALCRPAA